MRTVGSSAVGVAIFGVAAAACSSSKVALSTTSTIAASPTSTIAAGSTSTTAAPTTTATVVTTTGAPITDDVRSQRVDLGFVSAYVIERGDGLVVVDTGATGSAPAIRAALDAYGKSWADVGYVIATHKHGDHVGSLNDVLAKASEADVFAGDLDVAAISSGRPITPLFDGDTVNSVRIVATPGHTPGHISILDPDIGLFSGDALNGANGTVVGPNPKYTPDLETAFESVKKLATFSYEQAFFGHGEPVLSGASAAVQTLADTL